MFYLHDVIPKSGGGGLFIMSRMIRIVLVRILIGVTTHIWWSDCTDKLASDVNVTYTE